MGVKLNSSGGGSVEINPPSTGSTFTLTAPAITDTIVTKTSTDTLTNKTLTSPTLTSPTITSPTITGASMSSMSSSVLTSMTAQASTSGTTIPFTGIPSWAKRLTVMLNGVSGSGTSLFILQLGYGATPTWVTSGYSGAAQYGSSASYTSSSNAAGIYLMGASAAAALYSGLSTITLLDASTNTWAASGVVGETSSNYPTQLHGWSVALSGTLTAVRLNTVNGTDTFDAGKINVMYE